ncbi:TlpA disulfide reductase family protein [Methylosoma difficile]
MNFKIIAFVVLLLVLMSGYVLKKYSQLAPDVRFTTITGHTVALSHLRGKTVLVTFWSSDCKSCVKEMPDFAELYRIYHPQGLEIIAVAMAYDPPSHVVAMAEARHLPYPVALDLDSGHAKAFGNVSLTPSTFLISPSGIIVRKLTGLFDIEEMKTAIEQLLKG